MSSFCAVVSNGLSARSDVNGAGANLPGESTLEAIDLPCNSIHALSLARRAAFIAFLMAAERSSCLQTKAMAERGASASISMY